MHAKVSSDEIYTQISIRMSKQVHAMTHLAVLQKPRPLSKEEASCGDVSKEEMFAPGMEAEGKPGERMTV